MVSYFISYVHRKYYILPEKRSTLTGDKMDWIEQKLEKIKNQDTPYFLGWVVGKFFFGLGIGALLAVYYPRAAWEIHGWWLISLAIIVCLPTVYNVFLRKK
jgi:hypothetical protein